MAEGPAIDFETLPTVVVEHLHAAFVPIWSLPPGLRLRPDDDGLTVLDLHCSELVTIPWDAVPFVGA